jgi:hypothetical protein
VLGLDEGDLDRAVRLALAPTEDVARLVHLLGHPNGWHRDTAARLLYERQDAAAAPLLRALTAPLAAHHALGVLAGLDALTEEPILAALTSPDACLRERGILYAEKLLARAAPSPALVEKLSALVTDADARVRFQLAFTLPISPAFAPAFARLAARGDQRAFGALFERHQPGLTRYCRTILRHSADAVLKHLRELSTGGGMAHAFNGSEQQAQAFLGLGFKLGFGGAVTFEPAQRLRRLASTLPLSSRNAALLARPSLRRTRAPGL